MSGSGKEAVRLCEHIVRQAFGDVPCVSIIHFPFTVSSKAHRILQRVASTLLHRGRLSIFTLKHLTALSLQHVRAAVLILLQHNLLQYSQLPSVPGGPVTETYEFVAEECLLRLRWGRILALTEARVGVEAAEVIRAMMVHGRMTGGQVHETCSRPGDNACKLYLWRRVQPSTLIYCLLNSHECCESSDHCPPSQALLGTGRPGTLGRRI